MSTTAARQPENEQDTNCIVRSVPSPLASDPTLEAVTIDRAEHKISVATLGQVNETELATRVSESVRQAQASTPETGCTLLSGNPDCSVCRTPLTPAERKAI